MLPKPKKSLGQNFLVGANLNKKIVEACRIKNDETVIEIGPGKGALTGLIAEKAKYTYAVEIDKELSERLCMNFIGNTKVKIILADFLKIDLNRYMPCGVKTKIIGNIPYYITTPIIEKLLKHSERISSAYLTVQKEYARRICAEPGCKEYGSLSCFVRYYAKPKIEFYIKSGSFYPKPKVDSALISLQIHSKPPVELNDRERFFTLIRSAFAQKRKTLKNNLKSVLPQQTISSFLEKTGLGPKARAEELSLQNFADLANL